MDPKAASAPATDAMDTSMLEDLLGMFGGDAPHNHGGHAADECLVCYDVKDAANRGHTHQHSHFGRCGHGHLLCNNCADKVHRCPLCRDIKEGWESYVMATEALQDGRPCDEVSDTRATSVFLPLDDDAAPSCSAAPAAAPAPNNLNLSSSQLDAELDAFLTEVTPGLVGDALAGAVPTTGWHNHSQPQQPTTQPHQSAPATNTPLGDNAEVPMEEEPASAPPRAGRSRRRTAGVNRRNTSPAPPARKSASRQPQSAAKPAQRANTVTQDPDNPFAAYGVPDDEVELVSFKDFQALMQYHNFSSEQVAAGKRFRKRLKNRRQVMLYADKQRKSSKSLKVQNEELMVQVQALTEENEELKGRNHFLEQTLEYLEQARTDAVNECSALQQQMLQLTTQMNELGFFDDHMVSLE